MHATQRAGLSCLEFLPQGQTETLIVLCHGFGAPGDDLAAFGPELHSALPDLKMHARIVFPQGPLSLESMGWGDARAWWMIDMAKLQLSMHTGKLRDLRQDHPEGMDSARNHLVQLLKELQAETTVPWSRVILGGFSQGAMVTVEALRHLPEKIGGAILFSGTLINEPEWRQPSHNFPGLPILQSHGRSDVILPYSLALELRDLLVEQGAQVDFVEFNGGHGVPQPALRGAVKLIQGVLSHTT